MQSSQPVLRVTASSDPFVLSSSHYSLLQIAWFLRSRYPQVTEELVNICSRLFDVEVERPPWYSQDGGNGSPSEDLEPEDWMLGKDPA
jgi:hypothetical protein